MAQDFMATFHVGSSDKTILQVDADGVALAALQALTERVKKLERRNAALERELQELRAQRARRALRPSP
jgi:cell division protein FtsB